MAHCRAIDEAIKEGEPLLKAQTKIMALMLGVDMAMKALERKEDKMFQDWFVSQDNKEIAFYVEMASYHLQILFDANMYKENQDESK